MDIIDKIEIRYFRSLYTVRMNQIKDLNIITGKNDAGKSNILKALNLFFNTETDFNRSGFLQDFNKQRADEVRLDSIKGKSFIQVKITFNRVNGFENTLPTKFTVTKTWLKDGVGDVKDDIKSLLEKVGKKYGARNKASLTKFLNRIKYFYIPAIKDKNIFQKLLLELRDTLFDAVIKKDKNIDSSLNKLNTVISESALELSEEYKNVTGIETELTTSKNLDELFRALNINTKYKNHDISLDYRGDGIRVRYLPSILDYIAKNSKYFCIWGFEEPENSLEYALANEMAKQFANVYSKKSQIFITTHSIAFFNINSNNSQLFRCFVLGKGTELKIYNEANKDLILDKEIGQFEIQKELHKDYENKIAQLERQNLELKKFEEDLKTLQKPLLLTEGKTDVAILTKAWNSLHNNEMPFVIKSCNIYNTEQEVSAAGTGQLKRQLCCIPHDFVHEKVVGLFDRDTEGEAAFSLDGNFIVTMGNLIKKHKNNKVYAILLPIVPGREVFAHYKNLPIEFYFDEKYLRKIIKGKCLRLIPEPKETKVRGMLLEKKDSTELYFNKIDRNTKTYFAEKIVPTFPKEAFANFQFLFDIINNIINEQKIPKQNFEEINKIAC